MQFVQTPTLKLVAALYHKSKAIHVMRRKVTSLSYVCKSGRGTTTGKLLGPERGTNDKCLSQVKIHTTVSLNDAGFLQPLLFMIVLISLHAMIGFQLLNTLKNL